MEEYARRIGPIKYTLVTTEPSMKAWARSPEKGAKIFQWKEIEEGPDGILFATITIKGKGE